MSESFRSDIDRLAKHYTELVAKHGDAPQSAQWPDRGTQEGRMTILCEVGVQPSSKVLDFGCGTGQMLDYLRRARGFQGEYVGCDISPEMVSLARGKFPGVRFEVRNVLESDIPEDFDFVLISGVFNNRVSDNWGMMTEILTRLFLHVRTALAFNALSRFVDFFDDSLFYADPMAVFRFCKETLSPRVTLRHDYCLKPGVVPYEFCVYVHATDIRPRPLLIPS